ncbi:thioredoxin-disulfide reductase [bacterium (Candidatus Gribaldobacteria) CG07_land_8_20_14_0_80_33_18]|uniref:Thioredoxin-disulfide reductase n=1 Tax=bacterium (Candidatus Gribaldobacteria) CG07_land_8_20_14_0_80_33_18 TaxID=2014272 RepID=A0A2M6Z449_9BACT|nr:MAG: thioredoxin-disulfide reductase [bacterium (Candidatus Gribaldobacteria) CG07_land_8_20_14_0_80_33_18]PJB09011.1 MAG: thioredoxin-disulfide reductase [bacterium (Candidatus Gribaldobacteria) CG_4_9_14_3_um_filter_33_9]
MEKIYDLIIIGGGPAGITAGIYAARKRLRTLVLTKDFIGQVGKTSQIDNYPGFFGIFGLELIKKFEEHLKKFEIDILEGEEIIKVEKKGQNFLVKTKQKKEFLARAIIIATGRDPRPLEVEGEKEFIGKGVSYCSICDAPFFKDKSAAVIGGGNSGFEAALDLTKYAKRIFIFEKSDKIIADEILQEQASEEKKIEIHLNKEIKKIEGRGKVQAIIYDDLKTGKTFQVPIHGVFIQIGSIPATSFIKELVEFNEMDEIKVNFETCETSMPGIFAAGDVNEGKDKQIVLAAGEGARAALNAYEYIRNAKWKFKD